MSRETIIIVDDEVGMLNFVSKVLAAKGYRVLSAADAAAFRRQLDQGQPPAELALIDYRLPDANGLELLAEISSRQPPLPSIMITAYGEVELAVESMRSGAADFLAKPFSGAELLTAIDRVLEPQRLKKENELLRWQLESDGRRQPALICHSQALARAVALAEQVASSTATVLLTGESGTGKEVVAAHIHHHDPVRRRQRFLAVNCGALADNLLETQLFGALRGAYTGADKDTPGLFRAADQGTLLLDEIAETSPALQLKLLRVLEKKEVTPVGGTVPEPVDVRIIAATNRDLEQEVKAGRFRADLYYRLQVFAIELPPLRQRRDDIIPLVDYFLDWYCREEGKKPLRLTPETIAWLKSHDWPGNVRELRNLVHRAVILARQPLFDKNLLPGGGPAPAGPPLFSLAPESRPASLQEVELAYIETILRQQEGDRQASAQVLGISEKTLGRKLKIIRQQEAQ